MNSSTEPDSDAATLAKTARARSMRLLAAFEQAHTDAMTAAGNWVRVAGERDEALAQRNAAWEERDAALARIEQLETALSRAADALHDAAWVMDGAPPSPPLPAPITLVLPQTVRVEAESRAALAGGSGSGDV